MTRSRDIADSQDNFGGPVTPFVAGKNKIINGDFGVWQRGTSGFSLGGSYNADRFAFYTGTSTNKSITQQTFTPGTAPVAGYESQYYWRFVESVATVADANVFYQKIEDVRTFAGQTVTLSFWAKSTTTSSTITPQLSQVFGSGGSANVDNSSSAISLTTSWARYSATFSLASISGKTIGTSSYVETDLRLKTNLIQTVDIWGVQLESGSVATAFQTATGTIQGELSAAQRYYWRSTSNATNSTDTFGVIGNAYSTTNATTQFICPVTMRVKPTAVDFANLQTQKLANFAQSTISALSINNGNPLVVECISVSTGLTSGDLLSVRSNAAGTGYVGFSAEL